MPSTKGDPTDPELREKIKNSRSNIPEDAKIPYINAGLEIQSETGGGWAAWKVSRFLPSMSVRLDQTAIVSLNFQYFSPRDVFGHFSHI